MQQTEPPKKKSQLGFFEQLHKDFGQKAKGLDSPERVKAILTNSEEGRKQFYKDFGPQMKGLKDYETFDKLVSKYAESTLATTEDSGGSINTPLEETKPEVSTKTLSDGTTLEFDWAQGKVISLSPMAQIAKEAEKKLDGKAMTPDVKSDTPKPGETISDLTIGKAREGEIEALDDVAVELLNIEDLGLNEVQTQDRFINKYGVFERGMGYVMESLTSSSRGELERIGKLIESGKATEEDAARYKEMYDKFKSTNDKYNELVEYKKQLDKKKELIFPGAKAVDDLIKSTQKETDQGSTGEAAFDYLPSKVSASVLRLTQAVEGVVAMGADLGADATGLEFLRNTAAYLRVSGNKLGKGIQLEDAKIKSSIKGGFVERYVELEGTKVVVDEKGDAQYVRDSKGLIRSLSSDELQTFIKNKGELKIKMERSIARASNAAFDSGIDMARDILITRGILGRGALSRSIGANQAMTAGTTFIQEAGATYLDLYEKGEDEGTASLTAFGRGSVIAILETFSPLEAELAMRGVKKGTLNTAKEGLIRKFLAGEIPKEALAQTYTTILRGFATDVSMQGAEEILQEIGGATVNSLTGVDGGLKDISISGLENVAVPALLLGVFGAGANAVKKLPGLKSEVVLEALLESVDLSDADYDQAVTDIGEENVDKEVKTKIDNLRSSIKDEVEALEDKLGRALEVDEKKALAAALVDLDFHQDKYKNTTSKRAKEDRKLTVEASEKKLAKVALAIVSKGLGGKEKVEVSGGGESDESLKEGRSRKTREPFTFGDEEFDVPDDVAANIETDDDGDATITLSRKGKKDDTKTFTKKEAAKVIEEVNKYKKEGEGTPEVTQTKPQETKTTEKVDTPELPIDNAPEIRGEVNGVDDEGNEITVGNYSDKGDTLIDVYDGTAGVISRGVNEAGEVVEIAIDEGGKVTRTTGDTIEELGNVEDAEVGLQTVEQLGVTPDSEVNSLGYVYEINGERFVNTQEQQNAAIEEDEDGNLVVTLSTRVPKGSTELPETRTFTGRTAELLAEQIHLNEALLTDDARVSEFEAALEAAGLGGNLDSRTVDDSNNNQKNITNEKATEESGTTKQTKPEGSDDVSVDETEGSDSVSPEVQREPTGQKTRPDKISIGDRVTFDAPEGKMEGKVLAIDGNGDVIIEDPEDPDQSYRVPHELIYDVMKQSDLKTVVGEILKKVYGSSDHKDQRKALAEKKFDRLSKLLARIAPDLELVIHDTPDAFGKATGQDKLVAGSYDPTTGTVHVNLAFLADNTLEHEITHPILDVVFATYPHLLPKFYNDLKDMARNEPAIYDKYIKFGNKYKDNNLEESIVEFIADVLAGKVDIPAKDRETIIQKIKNFLDKFFKDFPTSKGPGVPLSRAVTSETSLSEFAAFLRDMKNREAFIDSALPENTPRHVRNQIFNKQKLLGDIVDAVMSMPVTPSIADIEQILAQVDSSFGTPMGITAEDVLGGAMTKYASSISKYGNTGAKRRLEGLIAGNIGAERLLEILTDLESRVVPDTLTDAEALAMAEELLGKVVELVNQQLSSNPGRKRWDVKHIYLPIAHALLDPKVASSTHRGVRIVALNLLTQQAMNQASNPGLEGRKFDEIVNELEILRGSESKQNAQALRLAQKGLNRRITRKHILERVSDFLGMELADLFKTDSRPEFFDTVANMRRAVYTNLSGKIQKIVDDIKNDMDGDDADVNDMVDKIVEAAQKKNKNKNQLGKSPLTGKEILDYLNTGVMPKGQTLTPEERKMYEVLRKVHRSMNPGPAKDADAELAKLIDSRKVQLENIEAAKDAMASEMRLAGLSKTQIDIALSVFDETSEKICDKILSQTRIKDAIDALIQSYNSGTLSKAELKAEVKSKLRDMYNSNMVRSDMEGEIGKYLASQLGITDVDTINFIEKVVGKRLDKYLAPVSRGLIAEQIDQKVRQSVLNAQLEIARLEKEKKKATDAAEIRKLEWQIARLEKGILAKQKFAERLTSDPLTLHKLGLLQKRGILNDAEYYSMIAEAMGLKNVPTPAEFQKINDLVAVINLNSNFKVDRNKAQLELTDLLYDLNKKGKLIPRIVDAIQEMSYVGMLSNLVTTMKAITASTVSFVASQPSYFGASVVRSLETKSPQAVKTYFTAHANAINAAAKALREAPKALWTGNIEDPTQDLSMNRLGSVKGKEMTNLLNDIYSRAGVTGNTLTNVAVMGMALPAQLAFMSYRMLAVGSLLVDSYAKGYYRRVYMEDALDYDESLVYGFPGRVKTQLDATMVREVRNFKDEFKMLNGRDATAKEVKAFDRIRRDELINDHLDSDELQLAVTQADAMSKEASATGTVFGLLPGILGINNYLKLKDRGASIQFKSEGLTGAVRLATNTLGLLINPFMRVTAIANGLGATFTPVPLVGIAYDSFNQSKLEGKFRIASIRKEYEYSKGKLEVTSRVPKPTIEVYADIIKSVVGTATLGVILGMMFDWEEDELKVAKDSKLRVTGFGRNYSMEQQEAVGDAPWTSTTVYWGDEPLFNYKDTPFLHLLAPVGAMYDYLTYTKRPKNDDSTKTESMVGYFARSTAKSVGEAGYVNSAETITNLLTTVASVAGGTKGEEGSYEYRRKAYTTTDKIAGNLTSVYSPFRGFNNMAFGVYEKLGPGKDLKIKPTSGTTYWYNWVKDNPMGIATMAGWNYLTDSDHLEFTSNIDHLGNELATNMDRNYFLEGPLSANKVANMYASGRVPESFEIASRIPKAMNNFNGYYPTQELRTEGYILSEGSDPGLTLVYKDKVAKSIGKLLVDNKRKFTNTDDPFELDKEYDSIIRVAKEHHMVEMYLELLDKADVPVPKKKMTKDADDRRKALLPGGKNYSIKKFKDYMIDKGYKLEVTPGGAKIVEFK